MNLQNVSDIPPTEPPEVSEALKTLLPTDRDDAVIRDEFAILVARMCYNMQFFKENYGDVVQRHIPHPYEQEMSSKSELVSTFNFFVHYSIFF